MMREVRVQYLELEPPLSKLELFNVLLITNSVEETFFLMAKLEKEFNPAAGADGYVPHA